MKKTYTQTFHPNRPKVQNCVHPTISSSAMRYLPNLWGTLAQYHGPRQCPMSSLHPRFASAVQYLERCWHPLKLTQPSWLYSHGCCCRKAQVCWPIKLLPLLISRSRWRGKWQLRHVCKKSTGHAVSEQPDQHFRVGLDIEMPLPEQARIFQRCTLRMRQEVLRALAGAEENDRVAT